MENQNKEIEITDNASSRIAFLLSKEDEGTYLRIAVDGGGCSGFQYRFDFTKDKKDHDILIEKGDASIVIDDMSVGFMKDSVIDYIETLGAAHFEVRNPNASATCGCGNSFAV